MKCFLIGALIGISFMNVYLIREKHRADSMVDELRQASLDAIKASSQMFKDCKEALNNRDLMNLK